MCKLFMGIDTGTQGVRVGITDGEGRIRSACERKWDTDYPALGRAEQNPLVWWDKICEAIAECVSHLTAKECMNIAACAVCATSSTVIPVLADGTPLRPAIMWMDARSKAEMAMINATKHKALEYCGGSVAFEWFIPKILWLRNHEPDIYQRADLIVEQLDWINFKLCGRWTASKCVASCKWNYSDSLGGFSDDYFETIGFPEYREKIVTEVTNVGDVIGTINSDLADQLGINPTMKIVEGGVDAHTALLGMNAFAEGKMGIIMGTSFVHLSQISHKPKTIKGIWGPYENPLIDGMWLLEGGQITASGLVKWFRENFHTPLDSANNPYPALTAAAQSVAPGAEGLTVLDFFQGNRTPYKDAYAKGVIYGLNIKHTWQHIYRALLEGISFGTRNILENQADQGYSVDLIVACGGVVKDHYWMQMMADITGKSIAINEESQAGVLGCCLLAATGEGLYDSFQEAADAMIRVKDFYHPNRDIFTQYDVPYKRYLDLYGALKDLMRQYR